jgi:hypothetical protein
MAAILWQRVKALLDSHTKLFRGVESSLSYLRSGQLDRTLGGFLFLL